MRHLIWFLPYVGFCGVVLLGIITCCSVISSVTFYLCTIRPLSIITRVEF